MGVKRQYIASALKLSETQVQRLRTINDHLDPQLIQHINTGGLSIAKAAELAALPQEEQIAFLETNLDEMIKVSGSDPVPPPAEPAEEPADLNQGDLKTLLAYMDNLKELLANPVSVSSAERKRSEKTIKQIESLTRRLYTQIEKYTHSKERL